VLRRDDEIEEQTKRRGPRLGSGALKSRVP